MTEVTLHLDGDPVVKERDFYQAKLKEANERIRSLEYDNVELVKRDKELSERVRYMPLIHLADLEEVTMSDTRSYKIFQGGYVIPQRMTACRLC